VLDDTIKNNKYVHKIYSQILSYFPEMLIYYKTVNAMYMLHLIFYMIPRTILISVFCIDIFYFHKIENFYNFSILFLGILIYKYIMYSLKQSTEEYATYLNTWYLVEITSVDRENKNYFIPLKDITWLCLYFINS